MNISPVSSLSSPEAGSPADLRNTFRTKTVGTRLSVAELAEVEAAAKRAGQSLAEWLRENALREARQSPADPIELLLAELAATRYMLLNLFHSTAQANAEGVHLLPESVLKIRETADARKLGAARKMLQDFFAAEAQSGMPDSCICAKMRPASTDSCWRVSPTRRTRSFEWSRPTNERISRVEASELSSTM